MTDEDQPAGSREVAAVGEDALLVTRSPVPAGRPYEEYRTYLRKDFFASCAYCTLTEGEASTTRFEIDHYEPRAEANKPEKRGKTLDDYMNLMYSCDECNNRKGDLWPPDTALADGVRIFRPDEHVRSAHFVLEGVRVKSETKIGQYSIEILDLNRLSVRRLRDIRRRLTECAEFVENGVLALRKFPFDRLPKHIRGG